jgi:imidazolonepropionase-like amidohydrolase
MKINFFFIKKGGTMIKRIIVSINLLAIFLICSIAFGQTIVIRAGHLIDPVKASSAKNQIITIKEGKIVKVGEMEQFSEAARVIDLSNLWVMPGLMDAHVHLTLNVPPNMVYVFPFEMIYLSESTAYRALLGVRNARHVLEAGFTTVKDIGNDANYAVTDIKRAIEKGWFIGPTIFNTGKIIAAFGGQSQRIPPEQGTFWLHEYLDADSPDEIRKAVRQNIYYGANAIKLVADNSAFFYDEEEIQAAVTEAHKSGLTVAVHVIGDEAAKNVILGGADSIEHGTRLSDNLLKLMKKRGTALVPTPFPYELLVAMGKSKKDAKSSSEEEIDLLKRAHKIGVKMAFGTDVVVDLPGKNRGEMAKDFLKMWESAEIPPAKILKCMTTHAAELFRIQNERGSITPGYFADIIATAENPLDNIQALQTVLFVMKDGKVIKQEK